MADHAETDAHGLVGGLEVHIAGPGGDGPAD